MRSAVDIDGADVIGADIADHDAIRPPRQSAVMS
jgi:hypothetical protein